MLKQVIAMVALLVLIATAARAGENAVDTTAEERSPSPRNRKTSLSGLIVVPASVVAEQAARWKADGVTAVAVVLDEAHAPEKYVAAAKAISDAALHLYYWVEVGRNPAMAREHPSWMASLGTHDDWLRRFPGVKKPNAGEVAKAFPWVPITYRESYDAHLDRITELLDRRAAGPYAGLLLNDLQGGPSSCGCGNLLCRWATDYHVPSTATKLHGDDVAARFIAEVRERAADKVVVPVWTTECQDIDLPENLAPGGQSTGLCGGVPCAKTSSACPREFTRQWTALTGGVQRPVGVLALQAELEQTGHFASRAVAYLDAVPPKHGGGAVEHERLWLVIQGHGLSPEDRTANRAAAAGLGVGAVFESLVPMSQSFEPRVVSVK